MQPRIEWLSEKKLVGKKMTMSLAANKTFELWQSFMPQRAAIKNNIGSALFSLQHYDDSYFQHFNPATPFEKWAAAEVTDLDSIPANMESMVLPGGLYAVFFFKGSASMASGMFQYIFSTWLPASEYELDHRPHFELLGDRYKHGDPDSEEEIWIPIRGKKQ